MKPLPLSVRDPVQYDLQQKRAWAWQQTERLARKARSEMVRLVALREFLKRTDPEPTPSLVANLNGPVLIQWGASSPPSLPAPAKPSSTPDSAASTSSSATEASENPTWL